MEKVLTSGRQKTCLGSDMLHKLVTSMNSRDYIEKYCIGPLHTKTIKYVNRLLLSAILPPCCVILQLSSDSDYRLDVEGTIIDMPRGSTDVEIPTPAFHGLHIYSYSNKEPTELIVSFKYTKENATNTQVCWTILLPDKTLTHGDIRGTLYTYDKTDHSYVPPDSKILKIDHIDYSGVQLKIAEVSGDWPCGINKLVKSINSEVNAVYHDTTYRNLMTYFTVSPMGNTYYYRIGRDGDMLSRVTIPDEDLVIDTITISAEAEFPVRNGEQFDLFSLLQRPYVTIDLVVRTKSSEYRNMPITLTHVQLDTNERSTIAQLPQFGIPPTFSDLDGKSYSMIM